MLVLLCNMMLRKEDPGPVPQNPVSPQTNVAINNSFLACPLIECSNYFLEMAIPVLPNLSHKLRRFLGSWTDSPHDLENHAAPFPSPSRYPLRIC
jgi:hypothetical protein